MKKDVQPKRADAYEIIICYMNGDPIHRNQAWWLDVKKDNLTSIASQVAYYMIRTKSDKYSVKDYKKLVGDIALALKYNFYVVKNKPSP